MYTEYKIVSDYSTDQLEFSVSTHLKQGWNLVGGINAVLYVNNPDEYAKEGFDIMLYSKAIAR